MWEGLCFITSAHEAKASGSFQTGKAGFILVSEFKGWVGIRPAFTAGQAY